MKRGYYMLRFFIFAMLPVFAGCERMVLGVYGVKKIKALNEREIARYAIKYKVPVADNYALDTLFVSYLLSLDTAKYRLRVNNHFQPLQALYFNKTGYMQSFYVNCYAGGFPNLKWSYNGSLNTFPPAQQCPVDSILPFDKQLSYLLPLIQTVHALPGNYDYVVFVYWSRYMGRQSKRLIRAIQENCAISKDKAVKIVYVNTDNLGAALR